MPVTVGISQRSVIHKDSGGISTAFPDACNTPTPVGTVPIPYPNIAQSADADATSKRVECDGNPICLSDSNLSKSNGDEAGASGGLVSGKIQGKAEFLTYAFDVQIEGSNVPRAMDTLLQNDKNTPPGPILQPPVIVI